MYGQANNYGPRFGPPGSQPPRATFQPGLPPPPFHQRPQNPSQQMPPQISQPGPHLYQHGPPNPFPPNQAPLRTPNASESYRHFPPTVTQSYPGGQQPQQPSHFRAPNAMLPSHGPHHPEMIRNPHPLGALPPPPRIQGPMQHTSVFYPLPPYSGGVESVRPNPPLPPPPPPTASSGFSGPTAASPHPPRISETESLKSAPVLEPIAGETVEGTEELCTSAADSDMEMEDDITLTDKDEKTGYSSDSLLKAEELGGEEQSNAPQLSQENVLLSDTPSEFLNPHKKNEDLAFKLDTEVDKQIVDKIGATGRTSDNNLGKTSPLTADKLSPLRTSSAVETITSQDHSKITEAGDPIKLLQDYASDDNSESDDDILYKDMNLNQSKLSTSLAGESTPNKDTSSCLETDTKSQSRLSKFSTNHNASGADDNSKTDSQVKSMSTSLKVDEFGRLLREGSVDSDSDREYANRRERTAKRDRGRSRSRSPLGRRRTERSSRRRKDSRSRSRSRSPRNRRSRSRSPIYRRAGEFRGARNRSNGARVGECFDFIRGKCLRGASCRFVHNEVGKSDSSRRHKGNQKNPENTNTTKKERRNRDKTQTQEIRESRFDRKREGINMDSRQGDTYPATLPLMKNSGIHQQLESNTSVAEDQNADCTLYQRVGHSESDALPNQTTTNSPKNFSDRVPVPTVIVPTGSLPNASASQSLPSEAVTKQYSSAKELSPSRDTAVSIPQESLKLPPPPPVPPPPHGANALHRPHLPLGYSSVPFVAPVPFQPSHAYHHAQFIVPPNSSWTLPPPPPRPPLEFRFGIETTTPGVSSQFQQSHFTPRNDSHSGVPVTSGFLLHSQPSIQEPNTSTSLGLGSLNQQPVMPQELYANRTHQSSSEIHPFSHMQAATGHLKYHVGDGNVAMPGNIGYTSRDLPDDQEKNQSSLGSEFGLPRIVAHHNPYASTFEHPLGSKLAFASLGQDKGQLCADQKHVTDGQGVGGYGKIMNSAGGDKYDPLFDSVEPTSSARKKDRRKWEPAADSDEMEKSIGSRKPMDVDENSRHEVAAVASMASLDNDDLGETADAEVGVVENESPSDPVGAASAEERETETKSTGNKKKKKKDSRSTKPFKMAIADFVKDVLKPSWRQGNMSKEAFKTIVKKTVDKVSGAMKGHNVPKSQAKIDQYIDSSQRKLTKLVMGYVDKYVKV